MGKSIITIFFKVLNLFNTKLSDDSLAEILLAMPRLTRLIRYDQFYDWTRLIGYNTAGHGWSFFGRLTSVRPVKLTGNSCTEVLVELARLEWKKIMPKWSYLLLQGWLFMRRISLDRRLWGVPSASYPRLFPFAKILLPRRVPTGDGCKVLPIYQERIFRLPRGLRHRSAHNPFLVLCTFLQQEVE